MYTDLKICKKNERSNKQQCLKTRKISVSRFISSVFILLLFVIFGGTNSTFYALEVNGTNYTVTTEEDFKNAIQDINNKSSGEYTITLGSDIVVNSNVTLNRAGSSVTIYGENHTLSLVKSYISVTGNSVLNLGNSNYNKTLSIVDKPPQTGNACDPLLSVNNSAVLNMYKGVTLSGRNGVDTAGGVQLQSSTFNMYGGEISNCRSDSIAGGVLAYNSQFKMNGGTIKNCNSSNSGGGVYVRDNSMCEIDGGKIEGCNASKSGGGVYVYNSQFKMNSGTIKECGSVNYGGGVYTNTKFEMNGGTISGCTNSGYGGAGVCVRTPNGTDDAFEMSGGEIKDCVSTSNINYGLGGGLFVISGLANIKENSKIYNNHASLSGDDVFSFGTNAKLKLSNVPEGLILSETNHAIDGWYVDGVVNGQDTARWDKDNFAQKYSPSPEEVIGTQIALKAAHGAINYNYYNYTVKYYIDGTLDEGLTQTGTADTVQVDNIVTPSKCRIDSTDYINVVEPTSTAPGSFEVSVHCSKLVDPVTELRCSVTLDGEIINFILQDPYSVLPDGVRLEVILIDQESDRYKELKDKLGNKYHMKHIVLYDVNLYDKNGNKISTFEKKLKVLFQIPSGWNKENLEIISLDLGLDEEFEKNIVTIDGVDYLEFSSDHFSPYAMIDKSNDENENPEDDNNEEESKKDSDTSKENNFLSEDTNITELITPETGDPTNIAILLNIMFSSSLGISAIVKIRKH